MSLKELLKELKQVRKLAALGEIDGLSAAILIMELQWSIIVALLRRRDGRKENTRAAA